MSLSVEQVASLADHVLGAQLQATPIPKLTEDHPGMTVADGYQVQLALLARYRDRGQRLVGFKAGLTSRAKMRQMGVDTPSIGFLTEAMAVPEGEVVATDAMVHPRVECEVAFVLAHDLPGEDCTADDVLAATAFVAPSIEIIDSRFHGFRFDLQSVVADNSSSARFVVGGNGRRLSTLDRRTLGVVLLKNGEVLATGASAAVLGDPAEAVALVARLAASLGLRIRAGMTVLSGGITAAFPVAPGDHISARFQDLGVVDVRFS